MTIESIEEEKGDRVEMSHISVNTPSIVEYFAEHEKYKCGYCKSPDTNFSFGMWAHTLRVEDYQSLIDRGWRRSGKYCYKPIMDQTCCPMYTIKCEALDFKLSKSQKKVMKKISKYLKGELRKNENADCDESIGEVVDFATTEDPGCGENVEIAQKNVADIDISLVTDTRLPSPKNPAGSTDAIANSSSAGSAKLDQNPATTTSKTSSKGCKVGLGLDQSKLPPKKAKLIRLERKQNKLLSLGKSSKEMNYISKHKKPMNTGKSLEELFSEAEESMVRSKLELRLVRTSPMSPEYSNTSKQSYELYKKYQMIIHKDPADKLTEQQYARFLVKSPLQTKLVAVKSEEFGDTFKVSAKLYKKYQMTIHKDPPEECDEQSFVSFLVKSPLQPTFRSNGPPQGYGSFHQQYWLDDELIAVGVIDILPNCVSSVYFFYDPIYSFLSPGTYGSLCEVMLIRELNTIVPTLKYYYMGFYIHTCPKMRYKAAMRPSKLLCPETYVWCEIEKCLPKLDKEKYSRLNEDLDATDNNSSDNITQVSIYYKNEMIPYYVYKIQAQRSEDEDEVREYANLVGIRCAQKLLLYRS